MTTIASQAETHSLPTLDVTRIRSLRDQDLLVATKSLADREREITTLVLRHLEEIERRKLFADLRYPSLFEYAVRELKYSEAAAGRRIQAMRLLREIPALEEKIESGALSLSNISQAQSYFRDLKKSEPARVIRVEEKVELLSKLEYKSSREGERVILAIAPPDVLPRERERVVSAEHTEVKFLIDSDLKSKLEEVRSLLGLRGHQMGFAELVAEMAKLSSERLREKRFGKRRVAAERSGGASIGNGGNNSTASVGGALNSGAGEALRHGSRYIPQTVKHTVWMKAKGQCSSCGSKHHLQYDHVEPHALGGRADSANIQLLCASCNLRRGVKTFGVQMMRR